MDRCLETQSSKIDLGRNTKHEQTNHNTEIETAV